MVSFVVQRQITTTVLKLISAYFQSYNVSMKSICGSHFMRRLRSENGITSVQLYKTVSAMILECCPTADFYTAVHCKLDSSRSNLENCPILFCLCQKRIFSVPELSTFLHFRPAGDFHRKGYSFYFTVFRDQAKENVDCEGDPSVYSNDGHSFVGVLSCSTFAFFCQRHAQSVKVVF